MAIQQASITRGGSVTRGRRHDPYLSGQARQLSGRGEGSDGDGHIKALEDRLDRLEGILRSARGGDAGGGERG
jgi:hypothetical protein